ncbi:MAG: 50S ribosomal protein L15 [Candidatus Omnitrophica bacterium]|nr:50S ribosomal protein L15 [Candidatus Omnitrophota bacterium]
MVLKLENIGKPRGVKRSRKRKGRGIGSGRGKTSGRGHKGAKSRSGGGTYNPGFEGGQMPLIRRVPKRGFTNKWKTEWNIINIGTLQNMDSVDNGAVVDKDFLLSEKILKKRRLPLKVLGKGKLSKSVTVKANAFSQSAKKAIEEAGGKTEVVTDAPSKKAE